MLTLPDPVVLAMASTADALIYNALTHGALGYPAPLKTEVPAAHSVVLAGASQIALSWEPLLAPYGIEIVSRSAFIHATPEVKFTDPVTHRTENRELGDVLIVVDEMHDDTIIDRRAELIQAKVAKPRGGISLDKGSRAQRNLYMHWPKFKMPKGYSAGPWDLNDKACSGSADQGCRFGGIVLGPNPGWFQIPTALKMNISGSPQLGSWITRMALGTAGRTAATRGKLDPWSLLIHELLDRTWNRRFPSKTGQDRLMQTRSLYMNEDDTMGDLRYIARFMERRFPPDGPPTGRDEGGISTIHISFNIPRY